MAASDTPPDGRKWAEGTALLCGMIATLGICAQGVIDGDLMLWRGFDLVGVILALIVAATSAGIYRAITESHTHDNEN